MCHGSFEDSIASMRGPRIFTQVEVPENSLNNVSICPQLILQFTMEVLEHMNDREVTYKSIIRWCKPVHLIVIGLVDSGACSGCDILTDILTERYNVRTVCGNFVASHVQIQRGIGGPHQTKL